ncbi:MAG: hypothetical protein E7608_04115 [Ruminococcaceae bacterium]|nr:hypothetical protein [Oscillospiraceae bacterium]
MKKIISLILSAAMLMLMLASCGGVAETTTGQNATADPTIDATVATSATTEATSATTEATTAATTAAGTITQLTFSEGDLLAHWDFSEISADGTVADLTGNGHVGKVSGNVQCVEAADGNGVKFAGDGGMITVEDHKDFQFKNEHSFAVEIRFKMDESAAPGAIFQKGLLDGKGSHFGFWTDEFSKLNLGMSGQTEKTFASNNALNSEWHHIVLIQNKTTGTVVYYLDGVLQNSTMPKNSKSPVVATSFVMRDEAITFGSDGTKHFAGIIDDIKIYDYAINESIVLAEYDTIYNFEGEIYRYENEKGETFTLSCRVHYPDGYSENDGKTYPILLVLHGHGETGTDNLGQLRVWAHPMTDVISREDIIVVVPQCECDGGKTKEWVASNHLFNEMSNRSLPKNPTLALAAVTGVMNKFLASGKVDTNRVYAMGSSMGSIGIWELMAREKDMFTAAILMCGAGIPSKAENLLNVDIWAFHGTVDETVPYTGTKNMERAITEAGGTKMKATYLEGVDHNCMSQAFAEGDLIGWLISQTKAD